MVGVLSDARVARLCRVAYCGCGRRCHPIAGSCRLGQYRQAGDCVLQAKKVQAPIAAVSVRYCKSGPRLATTDAERRGEAPKRRKKRRRKRKFQKSAAQGCRTPARILVTERNLSFLQPLVIIVRAPAGDSRLRRPWRRSARSLPIRRKARIPVLGLQQAQHGRPFEHAIGAARTGLIEMRGVREHVLARHGELGARGHGIDLRAA